MKKESGKGLRREGERKVETGEGRRLSMTEKWEIRGEGETDRVRKGKAGPRSR